MLYYLLSLALSGLIVGGLARLAVPGPNPMGILLTIALGIGGALLAGVVITALGIDRRWGFVVAVLAAALLVYLYNGRSRVGYESDRRRGIL